MHKSIEEIYIYIYFACPSVWLLVSNKRQNCYTDRAQILCGTSCGSRESLWMIKISKNGLQQNSIFIKFLNILKIQEFFFMKFVNFFVLFYNSHKENMFIIEIEA